MQAYDSQEWFNQLYRNNQYVTWVLLSWKGSMVYMYMTLKVNMSISTYVVSSLVYDIAELRKILLYRKHSVMKSELKLCHTK